MFTKDNTAFSVVFSISPAYWFILVWLLLAWHGYKSNRTVSVPSWNVRVRLKVIVIFYTNKYPHTSLSSLTLRVKMGRPDAQNIQYNITLKALQTDAIFSSSLFFQSLIIKDAISLFFLWLIFAKIASCVLQFWQITFSYPCTLTSQFGNLEYFYVMYT